MLEEALVQSDAQLMAFSKRSTGTGTAIKLRDIVSNGPTLDNAPAIDTTLLDTSGQFYALRDLDDLVFYLHDHLGNTRVTYRALTECEVVGTKKTFVPNMVLVTENAVDYYPYGKVLREFQNVRAEKF